MKKIFYILSAFIFAAAVCYADDRTEVMQFFYDYVNAANTYNSEYFKYYTSNPEIVRIVEKPDGSKESVKIPFSRYKKETAKLAVLARLKQYKNKYTNIKISGCGADYRLSALREPSAGGKFPAEFVIGKDNSGCWKIKEEYMNTDVQRFLKGS